VADPVDEPSAYEIMQKYRDEEKAYCLESERGIEFLNKLCSDLGYSEQRFLHGSPLELFLQDNSGACEALIEWITTFMEKNKEWKEALTFDDEDDHMDSIERDRKAQYERE